MINGKLLPTDLTPVQSGVSLAHGAAGAWNAMRAAAASASISLTIAVPYGGYRDYSAQAAILRSGSASGIRVAPVGSSTHGFGTRVDVANWFAPRSTWVLANAARFGFVREFGAADPNHFKFIGSTETTEERTDITMFITRNESDSSPQRNYLIGELSDPQPLTDDDCLSFIEAGVRVEPTSPARVTLLVDYARKRHAAFVDKVASAVAAKVGVAPSSDLAGIEARLNAIVAALPKPPTAAENAEATADEIAERGKA